MAIAKFNLVITMIGSSPDSRITAKTTRIKIQRSTKFSYNNRRSFQGSTHHWGYAFAASLIYNLSISINHQVKTSHRWECRTSVNTMPLINLKVQQYTQTISPSTNGFTLHSINRLFNRPLRRVQMRFSSQLRCGLQDLPYSSTLRY